MYRGVRSKTNAQGRAGDTLTQTNPTGLKSLRVVTNVQDLVLWIAGYLGRLSLRRKRSRPYRTEAARDQVARCQESSALAPRESAELRESRLITGAWLGDRQIKEASECSHCGDTNIA
jgi:hypothetical protein